MIRRMAVVGLVLVAMAGCALKNEKLRLDEYEAVAAMPEDEASVRAQDLRGRVDGLWSGLEDQKLTAYITRGKIRPYFENEKDQTDFIAIYASLMRKNDFSREIVLKYRVNDIKIEPNGAVAHVDIDIWGRIYFLWYARIHESQRWEKSGGRWYLRPDAY
ncbi:MAG: hypothetical protein IT350_04125 [Deltaproteobacteria bacterium]|nr:hypothetical protein [Deltaproteobacteria bacterium]